MVPVEGHSKLYRDTSTGAIINKDVTAAAIYRTAVKEKAREVERLAQLERDVSDIKGMLIKLLKDN
jgi:hypothetical protein